MSGRIKCPGCGRMVCVNGDDRLRRHRDVSGVCGWAKAHPRREAAMVLLNRASWWLNALSAAELGAKEALGTELQEEVKLLTASMEQHKTALQAISEKVNTLEEKHT